MRLKRCICFVVLLSFVLTTLPSFSYAAGFQGQGNFSVKPEQSRAQSHAGCAGHHGHAGQKTAVKTDKSGKASCCDGKGCQCIGGACHGAAKLVSAGGDGFIVPRMVKASYLVEEDAVDAHTSSRIKRPPRA